MMKPGPRHPALAGPRQRAFNRGSGRLNSWAWHLVYGQQNKPTVEELALECLDDGCSNDSIDALLNQLKAEEKKKPQLAETIKKLERGQEKLKVEMEEIIEELLRGYSREGLRSQKNDEQRASECLEFDCSVETLEALLKNFQAEKDPSPESTRTVVRLQELRDEKRATDDMLKRKLEGLLPDENYKTSEELALECIETGCSAESLYSLLRQLKMDEKRKPQLSMVIAELEGVRAQDVQTIQKLDELKDLVAGVPGMLQNAEAGKSYEELAKECLKDGCSVQSIDTLLEQLQSEKFAPSDGRPSLKLSQTVEDLKELRAQSKRTDEVIKQILAELLGDRPDRDTSGPP